MSEARIAISMNVLKDCLGVASGELLAVVADDDKRDLAESVYEAGKRLGAESMLLVMQPRSRSGKSLRLQLPKLWLRRMWPYASRHIR